MPPKIGRHAVFLLGCQVTRTQRLPLGRADAEYLRQENVHAAIPLCDRIARGRQERRVRAVKRADDLPLRLAAHPVDIHARRGKNTADEPVRLGQQRIEKMRLRNLRVLPFAGCLLGGLYRLYTFLR